MARVTQEVEIGLDSLILSPMVGVAFMDDQDSQVSAAVR